MSRNHKTLLLVFGAVLFMVGLTAVSVPLYNLFCRATGYGGTTQRVEANAGPILERRITVRFNADVGRGLPWVFRPEIKDVTVNVGQDALISFVAQNRSDRPVTGTALFNVTPAKAGRYFNKTQCFCFDEQVLDPGQEAHFPVSFFIDPDIAQDPNMDDVKTITLSYTFFKAQSPELERGIEKFYNDESAVEDLSNSQIRQKSDDGKIRS